MADLFVNIGGDASGAVGAVAQAEAALAGMTGRRTCVLDIVVRGHKEAAAQLADLAKARQAASGTIDLSVDSKQVRDASKHLTGLNTQMDRAIQLGGGMRDLGGHFDVLGDSVGRAGQRFDEASGGMTRANRQLGAMNRHFARSAELGEDFDAFTDRASRLGGVFGGLGGVGRGVGGAVGAVGALGDSLSSLAPAGAAGTAVSGLMALTKATGYAALGSGLLTAGVGALGAGGAIGFGGMGGLLGMAGAGLTGGVLDLLEDKKGDPPTRLGQELKRVGGQAKQLARDAVEPYGDSLVRIADRGLAAATPQAVKPVKDAFAEIGKIAEAGAPQVGKSIDLVADAFERVTKGGGGQAFKAMFDALPGATAAVIGPVEQLINTFGALADEAFAEGVPAFDRMTAAAGNLGAELLRVGADTLAPFQDDVASMTDGVTDMVRKLEPVIRPSMAAVTSVVNATTGAVGNLAPEIQAFADTTTRNAPKIQQAVEGVGRGMLGLGEAGVIGGATAAPAAELIGESLQRNKGPLGALVGGGLTAAAVGGTVAVEGAGALTRGEVTPGGTPPAMLIAGGVPQIAGAVGRDLGRRWLEATLPPDTPVRSAGAAEAGGVGPHAGRPPAQVGGVGAHGPGAPVVPPRTMSAGAAEAAGVGPIGGIGAHGPARAAVPAPVPAAGGVPALPSLLQDMQSVQGQAGATGQSVQSMGQVMTGGLAQVGSAAQAPQQRFHAMTQSMMADAGGMAAQVPQATTQAMQGTQQAITNAAPTVQQGGADLGAAMTGGVVQGITTTETVIDTVIRKHVKKIIDVYEGELDAHSPSRRIAAISRSIPQGTAVGIQSEAHVATAAMAGLAGAVSATATEAFGGARTRAVGETWARNVVGGAVSVFKTDMLQQLMVPQIENQLAKARLGSLGALGPAGAGALVAKTFTPTNRAIGGGGAGGAVNVSVESKLIMDRQVIATVAQQEVKAALGQILDSRTRQSG